MFARVGIMRALNRGHVREFNPPEAEARHGDGLSQNGSDLVGPWDYVGDNHDAHECSRRGTF
jgi:hypothetical protein